MKADLPIRLAKLCAFTASGWNASRYMRARGTIMRWLASHRLYEPRQFALLDRFVALGDTVVDVGAHLGTYTHRLAELVGNRGRVLAVEPHAETASALERSLTGISNVKVLRSALGSHDGSTRFHVPTLLGSLPEPALASCVAQPAKYVEESAAQSACSKESEIGSNAEVPINRLDSLNFDFSRLRFIKVDIEGMEHEFLLGAKKCLAKQRPVIQFECNLAPQNLPKFEEFARQLQYELMYVDAHHTLCTLHFDNHIGKSSAPDTEYNFYLIPREQVDRFSRQTS